MHSAMKHLHACEASSPTEPLHISSKFSLRGPRKAPIISYLHAIEIKANHPPWLAAKMH